MGSISSVTGPAARVVILTELRGPPCQLPQLGAAQRIGEAWLASEVWAGNSHAPSGQDCGGFAHWPKNLADNFDIFVILTDIIAGSATRAIVNAALEAGREVIWARLDGTTRRVVGLSERTIILNEDL